jgi:protein O-GlcNAc transferase
LLLFGENEAASVNLGNEAAARGIARERLIFGKRLPVAEYLARYETADLFLDTLPYNAGTTTSDALWVGLPVLTCLGTTFAGRVAASCLNAIGLPELIASSLTDYEEMAVKLAMQPAALTEIRAKLAANRSTHPLFDTPRFCRHLESAYITMSDRSRRGEPPASFAVPVI